MLARIACLPRSGAQTDRSWPRIPNGSGAAFGPGPGHAARRQGSPPMRRSKAISRIARAHHQHDPIWKEWRGRGRMEVRKAVASAAQPSATSVAIMIVPGHAPTDMDTRIVASASTRSSWRTCPEIGTLRRAIRGSAIERGKRERRRRHHQHDQQRTHARVIEKAIAARSHHQKVVLVTDRSEEVR